MKLKKNIDSGLVFVDQPWLSVIAEACTMLVAAGLCLAFYMHYIEPAEVAVVWHKAIIFTALIVAIPSVFSSFDRLVRLEFVTATFTHTETNRGVVVLRKSALGTSRKRFQLEDSAKARLEYRGGDTPSANVVSSIRNVLNYLFERATFGTSPSKGEREARLVLIVHDIGVPLSERFIKTNRIDVYPDLINEWLASQPQQ